MSLKIPMVMIMIPTQKITISRACWDSPTGSVYQAVYQAIAIFDPYPLTAAKRPGSWPGEMIHHDTPWI